MRTSKGNTFGARPHNLAIEPSRLYSCPGCDAKWYGINLTDGNKIPTHFHRDGHCQARDRCTGSLSRVQ